MIPGCILAPRSRKALSAIGRLWPSDDDDDDDDGEQDDHEGGCSGRRGGGVGPVPSQRDDNHQEPLRHGEAQV